MRQSLFLLFLCTALHLMAQEPIRFGDSEVYLEANVTPSARTRTTSSLDLGNPLGNKLNVLVQFGSDAISATELAAKGVCLHDYLGSNAYYAEVNAGSVPSDFAGTGIRAVAPIRGEWKLAQGILANTPPEWAVEGEQLKLILSWFRSVEWSQIKSILDVKSIPYRHPSDFFRTVEVSATHAQALALAECEGVVQIRWAKPPKELLNREGVRLSGGAILRQPVSLGGRGLTGKGVRIGIWDGNAGDHVDYGNRIHRLEFEVSVASTGAHGMHTTGTIIGNGLLDERGRGVAPEAEIWTSNFNRQSNRKPEEQEMRELYFAEHISLTSNSYGIRFMNFCNLEHLFSYTTLGNQDLDVLAYYVPEMTHVYSCGNDQGGCRKPFSHATNYNKNIISVAAVNQFGSMTDFSSFGPLLDGRIFPIISARGEAVYSTLDEQNYKPMNGTSMSCPMVTGHLALLTQRWMQLHGGAVPYSYFLKALIANTADDAGNPGPDFKFGFGILNAEAAVTAMEKQWYYIDELEKGAASKTRTIEVPEGVKQLRVMLCWNDPVSAATFKKGETPIVNNLDLVVMGGSHTYFPYTLDLNDPNKSAVATKANAVDNIEQVVVFNPVAGAYTINVGGQVKQEDKQPYALVWYFDYGTPSIMSPLAGDIYSPSESVYFRTENMIAPIRIEFSSDGGKQFVELGNVKACDRFTLPADLAPCTTALVRATDAHGSVVTSGQFAIMPQVQNVKLTDVACSVEGWMLTWDAAPNAAKYEILRANLAKEDYERIAEVEAPTTEYLIPQNEVTEGRNIYAVRALSAMNIAGHRSVGVLARQAVASVVKATDLPYRETFVMWNYRNGTVYKGQYLKHSQQSTPLRQGLPFGSQMFVWQGDRAADDWANPFEKRDHVGGLEVCELDLTEITEGTKLQFLLNAYMSKQAEVGDACMRLLVNGEELADVQGRKKIDGDGTTHLHAWDFSQFAGQKIRFTVEFALCNINDAGVIFYYQLQETEAKNDVSLTWANYPAIKAKSHMASEVVNFMVHNNSGVEQREVSYSITVDDAVVHSGIIDKMAPYEDRVIEYMHDFTSQTPHKYRVRVRLDVANDADATNNTGSFEVYSMGNIITMPEVTWTQWNGQYYPDVPYKSIVMKDGLATFTDGRGLLENYNKDELAVLQLLPCDPKNVIQVTFQEHDLALQDTLYVYTGNVPTDLRVQKKDAKTTILGKNSAPRTFVSEAANGGVTFYMVGNNSRPGAGWVAEVREIPIANQWKLKSLTDIAGADANHKKLQVVVENLAPTPFRDVILYLTKGEKREQVLIPLLAAKTETSFVIPGDEIDVTAPMYLDVTAELARDGDVSDNKQSLSIKTDPFWVGGKITDPENLYISRVRLIGGESLNVTSEKRLTYTHKKSLTLYAKSDNILEFTLQKYPEANHLPASIRVWMDVNNDNKWEDVAPEMLKAVLEADKDIYRLNFVLRDVTPLTVGKRRMRIMLAADNDLDAFIKENKEIPWGQIIDLVAEVKDGKSPSEYELALLSLEAPQTARNLAMQDVSVKVQNNGLAALNQVKLAYSVNGGTEVIEDLTCNLPAYGGSAVVTFAAKADLSAKGKHEIKIRLVPPDVNLKDNELNTIVYNIPSTQNKLYGLQYEGVGGDELLLPLAQPVQGNSTLEGWWKLDKTQHCALLAGDKIELQVAANMNTAADNSLVLVIDEGIYVTQSPVIELGKWHHIAIVLESELYNNLFEVTIPTIYLDGKKLDIVERGLGYVSFQDLHLNVLLEGQQAMFRVWNKVRTQDEIVASHLKSVRDNTGKLPTGCLGEYVFTEGSGEITAFGDEVALIRRKDLTNAWQPINDLVSSVSVEGQSNATEKIGDNEFSISMPENFTAFDNVKVNFVFGWKGTQVLYNNKLITEGQTFDFGTEHELTFKVCHEGLFGVPVEQELKVKLEKDHSSACDLLGIAMPKAQNDGLKADLNISTPDQTIRFAAETEQGKQLDLSQIKLVVTALSDNAQLYLGEDLVVLNTPFTVDLHRPQLLKVVSGNKRHAKFYTVQLAMQQELTWDATPITRKFTVTSLPLNATATSNLPVRYYSLDPSVATVDEQGNLITAGVGTATVVATQEGNSQYLPAAPKQRQVIVEPTTLTVRVKEQTMAAGSELPDLELIYDGLEFPNTELALDAPYAIMQDGKPWNETMPALVPGVYDIVPVGYTKPYLLGNYIVTREKGKLTVQPAMVAQQVTFVVKDGEWTPLKGAMLRCGTVRTTTADDGRVSLYLKPGRYTVSVGKAGYTSLVEEFEVGQRAREITLQLRKKIYTLTYSADENGLIQGATEQLVAEGESATPVVALPKDDSYRFVAWDDDYASAARVDKNIHANLRVKAEFEKITYTLRYIISEGGEVAAGDTVQTVYKRMEGQPITVQPKAGYIFVGWSDGVKSPTRTDKVEAEDVTVEALFVKAYLLTWSENFELGEANLKGWTFSKPKVASHRGWLYADKSSLVAEPGVSGKALIIDPKGDHSFSYYSDFWAATPWLSLEGRATTTKVALEFKYYYQANNSTTRVQYCFEDEVWQDGDILTEQAGEASHIFVLDENLLRNHKFIRFRWNFTNKRFTTYFVLDDISVKFTPQSNNQIIVRYYAGENGSLQKEDRTLTTAIEYTTSSGVLAPKVVAVPAAGYEFERWSDGGTIAARQDSQDTNAKAFFKKMMLPSVTVSYLAKAHGRIEGMPYQILEKGATSLPVSAVPDDGFRFARWADGSLQNPRTDVLDHDVVFEAEFEAVAPTFTLTYKTDGGGAIRGMAQQVVESGKDATTVVAIAYQGYKFVKWDDNVTTVARTDKNVTSSKVHVAIFEPAETYAVLLDCIGQGLIQIQDMAAEQLKSIPANTALDVQVKPADGWRLVALKAGEQDILQSKKLVLRANTKVKATFVQVCEVTLAQEGEGTLSIEGYDARALKTIDAGTILKVVAMPSEGWKLIKLMAGRRTITDDGSFIVRGSIEVKAFFEKKGEPGAVDENVFAKVIVAPNPFTNHLRIAQYERLSDATYVLFDVHGRQVRSGLLEEGETILNTTDLPTGIYILRLQSAAGISSVKVLKI